MTAARTTGELLDRVARTSTQQRVLRSAVLLGTVSMLVTIAAAGGPVHPILSAGLLLVAAVVTLVPESHLGVALLLGLAVLWVISVPDRLDGWLLLATAELLTVHLGAALAVYGPAGHRFDPVLVRLCAARAVSSLAAAAAAWLVARLLTFLDLPGSGLALGTALAVVLAWVGFLTARFARPGGRA